ncbi:MFS general substrate transporter [Xylaria arbuscula]|nr:MFS general substrate transporter [Xylaria arbuscula]
MDEEERPLIHESRLNARFLGGYAGTEDQPRGPSKPWHIATTPRAISAVVYIAVFLWLLSAMIEVFPSTRLVQDMFCRRHYGRIDTDPIDEELCKAKEIKLSMVWLSGLSMSLNTVVGLVVMVPYSVFADRARKPVYLLAATGHFANGAWSLVVLRFWRVLPVKSYLLAPILDLIGGGPSMAMVLLYAIISDVNSPENRAMAYFWSSLAAKLAMFLGPPLSSKMTEIWSPWVPMLLSLVAIILAGGIILWVPETAHRSSSPRRGDINRPEAKYLEWRIDIASQFARVFHDSSLRSVLKRRSVVSLLLVCTLTAPLELGMGTIFFQYYSMRLGTSIEEAGYMLATRGGLTIVVVGVLLPLVSKCLSSSSYFRLSTFRRDLVLAQAFAAVAGLGYFLLGGPGPAFLRSGMVLLSVSTGISPLCRSLISNIVEPSQTSQVFAIASIVEAIGFLPAGFLLAWTFSLGLRLGGFWFALPFFYLGSLAFLALAVLWFIDTKPATADLLAEAKDD